MKKIKIITVILIIILLSLVSFGGLYLKQNYRLKNKVAEYKLGRNLSESRVIEIIPDETVNKVIKDADGNVVEEEAEGTTTTEEHVNSQEVLTKENFEKSKEIIIKRLKAMSATDYNIRLNEETGRFILEFGDNDKTNSVASYLSQKAKFTIIDAETKEELMNNSHIKSADVRSANTGTTTASTSIYLNIEFNKEGAKKLEEISNVYVKSSDENGNDTSKKISMQLDGQDIISTSFTEPVKTGTIQLSIGNSSNDTSELQEYVETAGHMAMLLNNEELPITYKIDSDQYVSSNLSLDSIMPYGLYVLIGIVVIILVLLFIKYKFSGILGTITLIGYAALLLLVLRYANVIITIEGALGIAFSIILDLILVKMLLKGMKNEEKVKLAIKKSYIRYFLYIIPICIIAIVFSFMKSTEIASLGMVMFWGIALIALYNITITRTMLLNVKK